MKQRIFFVVAVILLVSSGARAQLDQSDLRITNGLDSQKYMGAGKGVIVSIVDGGVDVTHPAVRNAVYLQKDFTGQKILDDLRDDVGHGTGVAGIVLGHDAKSYSGIAPAVRFINARVVTTGDRTTDQYAAAGLIWSAKSGAKVANMSFGNQIGNGRLTDKINLISDYLTEKYQMHIVSAAGNDKASAVQQSPGGNYNGFSVGALASTDYARVAGFSNYSLARDSRTKPDLVAPGQNVNIATADWEKDTNYYTATGTSFAAPVVTGVLAQMIGYGKSHKLPTDPLLLKAILMTSATKVEKSNGAPWTWRGGDYDPDYNYLISQPLDAQQGAGRIDAISAYRLYAKSRSKSNPYNLWREGTLKGNTSVTTRIGVLGRGQRVDATLTWYRHIDYKDLDGDGADVNDRYQPTSLADFTLTLLRNGVPVASSDSSDDNLEHISWTLTRPGDYSIQIYRFADSGQTAEQYAMAARVLKGNAPSIVNYSATGIPGNLTRTAGWSTGVSQGFGALTPEPALLTPLLVGMVLLRRRRG